jgi:GLPGLI family protein
MNCIKEFAIALSGLFILVPCSGQTSMDLSDMGDKNFMVFRDDYFYGEKIIDKSVLEVHYAVERETDSVSKKRIKYDAVLQIGQKVSKYTSLAHFQQDENLRNTGKTGITDKTDNFCFYDTFYHNYPAGRLSIATRLCVEDYLCEQPIPKIRWQMMPVKKTIGNYICQEAKCRFHGRDYTVWFTSEIPSDSGPWLLSGLPGLIVKASCKDDKYVFTLKDIRKVQTDITIANYQYAKVTPAQLLKMQYQMISDYFGLLSAHNGTSGIEISGAHIESSNKTFLPIDLDLGSE